MAAHMLKCQEDAIVKGLASIQKWQETINKWSQWLHADQDFSGTAAVVDDVPHTVAGFVHTSQGNLQALRSGVNPATLSGLATAGRLVADSVLGGASHRHRERAGSALASLSALLVV